MVNQNEIFSFNESNVERTVVHVVVYLLKIGLDTWCIFFSIPQTETGFRFTARQTPSEKGRIYSGLWLQRQYLFPKMLPLKWICCCKESLMDRLIYKKDLVLYLVFSQNICFGYLLESPQWGDSNKYPKHLLLEV